MQKVHLTWYKVFSYRKATNANVKWQLLIFDAVIRSKLLYVLDGRNGFGPPKKNWVRSVKNRFEHILRGDCYSDSLMKMQG